jgi:hypothetical protein
MAPKGPGKAVQEGSMARRKVPQPHSEAPRQAAGRQPRPDIVHSSLYLPEAVYEALRETAFKERCKIHDLVLQGIDLALRKRGYPPMEQVKAVKRH